MPVTLEEARKNTQDKLAPFVIDEFRKSNFLMNNLTFDDCVSPQGGGATMTYSYTRLTTQPTAEFREINHDYAPQEVTKERHSVDLKIFGGSFQVDRVIADMGGITNEVTLQMQQKIKAASALFNDTVINGDSATNANAFDGLEKAVAGSSTEYTPSTIIDLSTSDMIDKNYKYFLDALDEFLMGLDGTPSFIGGNLKLIAKIRACARRAAMYQTTKNDLGQQIESYAGIPLVNFGAKPGSNNDVVPVKTADGTDKGCTSLYAARFGLDGFHAVSPAGALPVKQWLPDYKTSGAVKTGEVELVAAVALKATKAAAVMRNIKVQ